MHNKTETSYSFPWTTADKNTTISFGNSSSKTTASVETNAIGTASLEKKTNEECLSPLLIA